MVKKGASDKESLGRKLKIDRRRKLNEGYLRKLRSLMKTKAANDEELVVDVTDNAANGNGTSRASNANASIFEHHASNKGDLQKSDSDEKKSESTDIISTGDQLMSVDTEEKNLKLSSRGELKEPANDVIVSQSISKIKAALDSDVMNNLETTGQRSDQKDICIIYSDYMFDSVTDFVPKSTSDKSPSYKGENWPPKVSAPNQFRKGADGDEQREKGPESADSAEEHKSLQCEVQSTLMDGKVNDKGQSTVNATDKSEDVLHSDDSELSSVGDLSLTETDDIVDGSGPSSIKVEGAESLTTEEGSTRLEEVILVIESELRKTTEQLIREEEEFRQEKERLLRIQIFKDLGLEESSRLSPLKRMKLDLEKKKRQSYEKNFSDELENSVEVEGRIKLKAEDSKRKFDETRSTSSALKIITKEADRKMIASCEKALAAERDAKIRNDDETRDSVEKGRIKNDARGNLKRLLITQKTQQILDTNKSDNQEWRKADIQQYDDERRSRIEGAIKVNDVIHQTLTLQRHNKVMRESEQKEALLVDRRRTLDAEEELAQLDAWRSRVADERREACDREYDDQKSKIDALKQERDRQRLADEESYAAERRSALNMEKNEQQARKAAYLEKERLLKAECKLRTEQEYELYLQQDSERLDRVNEEKRKSLKQNSRLSLEHTNRRLELNERASRSENERVLQQEIAYSTFLEEERKIECEIERKDTEEKEKRAMLEKRRLKHIESVETAHEELSAQARWDEDRKDHFEFSRREKDDNASKLREGYEKNISDELETKRCEKAERKLREENERKVQIEYERRIRESASGVKERSVSARRWRRSR